MIKTNGCVFCAASAAGISTDSLCLFKSEHAMLVLNKYPYNSGHLLVLPVRHCGDITELSNAEYSDLMKLLKYTLKVIKKEYQVDGMNVGLNMGAVAGAGIPDHLHWHIIPRWMGDTNFFPLIAETKVISETNEQSYNRYEKYFVNKKNIKELIDV
jgi:ATP adenylyltransferase